MQLVARPAKGSILLSRSRTSYYGGGVKPGSRWLSYCRDTPQSVRARAHERNRDAFICFRRDISTFRYTPLVSSTSTQSFIRLLKLHPGRGSKRLEASLEEVPLSSELDYEAVSYCWGEAEDVSTISCNDRQLQVPRRLEVALRNMRYSDKPRILWADAICINQLDTSEKESQVQLMRIIFSNAKRTLIFLGDIEDKQAQKMSKFALWSIKFGLSMLRHRVNLLSSPQIRVWDLGDGRSRSLTPFSFEFYLELIGMLRMPWFQRAWVVQEVAVSSKATIFWGSSQYDWEDVIQALKFMSKVNFPLAFIVTLENISTIEEERKFYREGQSKLNGVLLRHQRCMAKDPRDKIYSFCGLVKTPSSREPVRISYQDDVSTIYREVALKILEEDQSLDLLSRPPSLAGSRMKNLPSWVPDWSISSTSTLTYAWGHGPLSLAGTVVTNGNENPRFAVSHGSKYSPKLSSSDTLIAEGYQFDKIIEIGPIFYGVQVPYTVQSFPEILREWVHHFATLFRARNVFVKWQQVADVQSKRLYFTGETMREAFLQTLSAAEIHDSERVRFELELWDKGTSSPFGLIYSTFVFVRNFITDRPFLLFEIQGRYALHRRVVRTQNGFLGLASHATEVGDDLMVCKGSTIPLIMRRCGEKEDEFRLIGDAYVHGIMNGEAFDDRKCQEILIK
ncbi:HET-domain-containing protein [Stipitochalara longipes BDJ]|nr:HET-domain-containing protein [Stipitochalara longipes BDJ]